jgi:hypothetical protein
VSPILFADDRKEKTEVEPTDKSEEKPAGKSEKKPANKSSKSNNKRTR